MTANEQLLDALLRHQVYLLRYSGHIRDQIIALLNATEADIAEKIRARVEAGELTPQSLQRFKTLQRLISSIRVKAWKDVSEVWYGELKRLAEEEAKFVRGIAQTVSPTMLDFTIPSPEQLRSIALAKPFQGKTLKEWLNEMTRADVTRITDQIKIGMVQGETGQQIAKRIVGTTRLRKGSSVAMTNDQADAISRTAVNAIAGFSREEFFKENKEFFSKELFVATLDSRTTPICRSLDGNTYPVGEGPQTPLHYRCRSIRVAFFGQAIGSRPARNFTTQQLLREFAEVQGIVSVKNRDRLPRGMKKLFDEFARKRMRELTGTVPAKLTYQKWLERQPAWFQDDVLGKTRGALFRRGHLPLDHFVDRAGQEIPLSELAVKERHAFLVAGLDPEDFI